MLRYPPFSRYHRITFVLQKIALKELLGLLSALVFVQFCCGQAQQCTTFFTYQTQNSFLDYSALLFCYFFRVKSLRYSPLSIQHCFTLVFQKILLEELPGLLSGRFFVQFCDGHAHHWTTFFTSCPRKNFLDCSALRFL